MIIAIVAGQQEDGKFPGRNVFPLLGRPMMAYPLLAALHAQQVEKTFLTTDSEAMAQIASRLGVTVLSRGPAVSGPSVRLADVIQDAISRAVRSLGSEPEAVVILLCNAPTVTAGLIDHGIEILRHTPSLDAVVSVSLHNEFHPAHALTIREGGLVRPLKEASGPALKKEDAYFPDALLWVLRPSVFTTTQTGVRAVADWLVDWSAHRVFPLVHQGYGDVDYAWQVPAVEEWLRREGFSETVTPYARATPAIGQPAAATRRRPPVSGRRVLITTVPFGEDVRRPLELLEAEGCDYVLNPHGRQLSAEELAALVGDVDVLIAGTEPITAAVMDHAPRLRLISRVGIGLDSVDLVAARQREILVSYTPDAPAPAVAELTMGLILSLLRSLSLADRGMREGVWRRLVGRRLANLTVGIIGVGRVGKRVIGHLQGFAPRILANDLAPDEEFGAANGVRFVEKDTIYREADVITLHLPLTPLTRNLITRREIDLMKPGACLINTSRGGLVAEHDLAIALKEGRLGGVAMDVFAQEPYSGELVTLDNCLLTCHMGSMSHDCRARMELEATQEAIRFLRKEPLRQLVPEEEYAMRMMAVSHNAITQGDR